MATVRAISTTLPKHAYSKADICEIGEHWLHNTPHESALFQRFVSSSQIEQRHFALPLHDVLTLGGSHERSSHFQREGGVLLKDTIAQLLSKSGVTASAINHLITTSCSAPIIPAIDAGVIDELGLLRTVSRVPLYQHGCAGGVVGLALASRLVRPHERAVVAAVELCSLVYQAADLSGGNLVGSAIFGDGAAAVLLDGSDGGLRIVAAQSHLVPQSAFLMGYDIEDDGAHLRLDRALPQALSQHAPPFLRAFLAEQELTPQDISWWLFHPGGVKVLAVLEDALGIQRLQSRWAWEVLERYGNMSSASILFVLDSFLQSNAAQPGENVCMLGVGPGLTIEAILMRYD